MDDELFCFAVGCLFTNYLKARVSDDFLKRTRLPVSGELWMTRRFTLAFRLLWSLAHFNHMPLLETKANLSHI